jgi:hypothetical protein
MNFPDEAKGERKSVSHAFQAMIQRRHVVCIRRTRPTSHPWTTSHGDPENDTPQVALRIGSNQIPPFQFSRVMPSTRKVK